ncbi:hydantoinase/oxoprolinase family protein [Halorubraceae archaeon YAN]|nr:hydantoinase/oxoprolinase family protein [Halorubraceae archaeon YAN]
MNTRRVRVGVDVGGTFTDAVLHTETAVFTAKVPTTAEQSNGVLNAIDAVCAKADIEPDEIDSFVHAMTVSVNALLENDGAKTALLTTAGFEDVLAIGRQSRPSLYDLSVQKPPVLIPRSRRIGVTERATIDGIETAVDPDEIESIVDTLTETGVESVAISFLHAYAHPENEQRTAALLREKLDIPVSASHEILSAFREYERTATTAVDAYVAPAIDRYLGSLSKTATERGIQRPRIMQANGGIAAVETVRETPVTTVLSGPAAGVVGANTNTPPGTDVVTFDMGGTSTDVSLIRDGTTEMTTAATINNQPISIPMVDIHTVGAGGGSIGWIDDGSALRVGPRSAGAEPGPACYGHGGVEPTVTDANVVLGYLGTQSTVGESLSLDRSAAETAVDQLVDAAQLDTRLEAAFGIHRIANANMTRAIRSITVEEGHDPRSFELVAFGGAGPVHAAALASSLGIQTVRIPYASGVLSAYGLLAADEKHTAVKTVREPLDSVSPSTIAAVLESLTTNVVSRLDSQFDPSDDRVTVTHTGALRYRGQSFELPVELPDPFDRPVIADRFHTAHERAHGYQLSDPIEIVTVRSTLIGRRDPISIPYSPDGTPFTGTRSAYFDGEFRETSVYRRNSVSPETDITGPAVIESAETTIVVPPQWGASTTTDGTIVLSMEGSQ